MTFDEVLAHYASFRFYRDREVFCRADLSAEDLRRRANSCLCGYCGEARLCPCGEWNPERGWTTRCTRCGRPSWCEM